MKSIISKDYLEVFKQPGFLVLSIILFLFQAATAFVLLGLISTVFSKTGSNFSVSGVIVSFSIPGFLLLALSGLIADLIDRKKIILIINALEVLIIFLILLTINTVYVSITLSFIYFTLNAFFLPAVSAATSQLVKKSQLLVANSIFIFNLAGGQLFGFIVAAFVHFLFGSLWTLLICEAITVVIVWLTTLLPPLLPFKKIDNQSFFANTIGIWSTIKDILGKKVIWFYFVLLASMQGLIAFGVTIGPGFFDEVVGLSIDKSPIFVLPMVTAGVAIGAIFVHNQKVNTSYFVSFGLGLMGLVSFILGLILKLGWVSGSLVLVPIAVFLSALGFGVIVTMIASRAVIQRKVSHSAQGTAFGALVVLASFFAGIMSPLAAGLEALMGYVNLLILGGLVFTIFAASLAYVGGKWKF